MNKFLQSLIAVVIVIFGLSHCTVHRTSTYETMMSDLRSQVQVGDNIHSAAKKIEGRYHYTSGPLDPTDLGKELWLHVDFGLKPSAIENIAYTSDVNLPSSANRRISAMIKATPDGTITTIE
jgi:hypothetical protein